MQLGIDFGTTRTVVACCDRGNYPILTFEDDTDTPVDWYPSVIAERRGELRFGWSALAVAGDPEWAVLRSVKRLFSGPSSTPDFQVQLGSSTLSGTELVARFLTSLRDAILTRSNRPRSRRARDTTLTAVVATPASAHGTQRFITLDAFRRAGFEVVGMLNEPSAAGFEYTHRYRSTVTSKREHIVVYDLGGGTFDASLVHISGKSHEAIATAGGTLGGDDFDALLVDQTLAAAGLDRAALDGRALRLLSDHCREAKERIHASTKRITIDLEATLGGAARVPQVTLPVTDYFDACVPLVQRTLDAMAPVLGRLEVGSEEALDGLAGLYVVGGASSLPVVGRVLRDTFGRRVHRSAHPSGAIAMGLAIAADDEAGFILADRLSRHFGVFREGQGGRDVVFDPIFDRDTRVPARKDAEAVVQRRVYRAAHNVGRYRFVECAALDGSGVPIGDITAYKDVFFAFDRDVRGRDDLGQVPVHRMPSDGPLIEEKYTVTPLGMVSVTITDLDSGYAKAYQVGA
jgi:molecular chaperone DnaK (HSP70)